MGSPTGTTGRNLAWKFARGSSQAAYGCVWTCRSEQDGIQDAAEKGTSASSHVPSGQNPSTEPQLWERYLQCRHSASGGRPVPHIAKQYRTSVAGEPLSLAVTGWDTSGPAQLEERRANVMAVDGKDDAVDVEESEDGLISDLKNTAGPQEDESHMQVL